MWKAYTREKPARRGWALAAMIVALMGTLALAQWQIGLSGLPDWKPDRTVDSDNWPISFDLPTGFGWEGSRTDINMVELLKRAFGGRSSEIGSAVFSGSSKQIPAINLQVGIYGESIAALGGLDTHLGTPDGRLTNCKAEGFYWTLPPARLGQTSFSIIALPEPKDDYYVLIEVDSRGSSKANGDLALWIVRSINCK